MYIRESKRDGHFSNAVNFSSHHKILVIRKIQETCYFGPFDLFSTQASRLGAPSRVFKMTRTYPKKKVVMVQSRFLLTERDKLHVGLAMA
jgi:hypothetical protein